MKGLVIAILVVWGIIGMSGIGLTSNGLSNWEIWVFLGFTPFIYLLINCCES